MSSTLALRRLQREGSESKCTPMERSSKKISLNRLNSKDIEELMFKAIQDFFDDLEDSDFENDSSSTGSLEHENNRKFRRTGPAFWEDGFVVSDTELCFNDGSVSESESSFESTSSDRDE